MNVPGTHVVGILTKGNHRQFICQLKDARRLEILNGKYPMPLGFIIHSILDPIAFWQGERGAWVGLLIS